MLLTQYWLCISFPFPFISHNNTANKSADNAGFRATSRMWNKHKRCADVETRSAKRKLRKSQERASCRPRFEAEDQSTVVRAKPSLCIWPNTVDPRNPVPSMMTGASSCTCLSERSRAGALANELIKLMTNNFIP